MKHDGNMLAQREISIRTESPFVRYFLSLYAAVANFLRAARSSQSAILREESCMPEQIEVPSDDEVIGVLQELHGKADARALCAHLMEKGHPRLASQLAIQRTAERGKIVLRDDWTFAAVELEVA